VIVKLLLRGEVKNFYLNLLITDEIGECLTIAIDNPKTVVVSITVLSNYQGSSGNDRA
jgi:hypothetical protein